VIVFITVMLLIAAPIVFAIAAVAKMHDESSSLQATTALLATSTPTASTGVGYLTDPPIAYAAEFNKTKELGIDPRLLAAVAWKESRIYDEPNGCGPYGSSGEQGIMQFMPSTAQERGVNPCEPSSSIPGAAKYLVELYKKFGNWQLALAGYNRGPGDVEACMCIPGNQQYVTDVETKFREFREQFPDQAVGAQVAGARQEQGPLGPVQVVDITLPVGPTVAVPSGKLTVNASIAGNVQRMVTDAANAGHMLTGWGYRTHQRQRELRIENGCPDVCCSPSSSCRVPTAVPGQSSHEWGEAIDFICGDSTHAIGSRSDSCYRWLDANARTYGLYELSCMDPTKECDGPEPWHWSVDSH
jgi:hypothetical protein